MIDIVCHMLQKWFIMDAFNMANHKVYASEHQDQFEEGQLLLLVVLPA